MSRMSLIERLCRSLAIMTVEAEITLPFMEGGDESLEGEVEIARDLITEAGYDFDTIYPVDERPVAVDSRPN